jgi:hypothetical protein
MIDLNDKDLSILDHDSVIIEQFGEKHLADALRIISTRSATSADHELIYDAICIATAVYMKKLKDGEVHINRVYH